MHLAFESKMAGLNGCARSVISQISRRTAVRGFFARRSLPVIITTRNDGIFTKYREPPNGFLFNEKVCVCIYEKHNLSVGEYKDEFQSGRFYFYLITPMSESKCLFSEDLRYRERSQLGLGKIFGDDRGQILGVCFACRDTFATYITAMLA